VFIVGEKWSSRIRWLKLHKKFIDLTVCLFRVRKFSFSYFRCSVKSTINRHWCRYHRHAGWISIKAAHQPEAAWPTQKLTWRPPGRRTCHTKTRSDDGWRWPEPTDARYRWRGSGLIMQATLSNWSDTHAVQRLQSSKQLPSRCAYDVPPSNFAFTEKFNRRQISGQLLALLLLSAANEFS